jgi:hypothetical protein
LHSLAGFKYQLSASQYITAWEAGSKKGQLSEIFSNFPVANAS